MPRDFSEEYTAVPETIAEHLGLSTSQPLGELQAAAELRRAIDRVADHLAGRKVPGNWCGLDMELEEIWRMGKREGERGNK